MKDWQLAWRVCMRIAEQSNRLRDAMVAQNCALAVARLEFQDARIEELEAALRKVWDYLDRGGPEDIAMAYELDGVLRGASDGRK